MMEAGLDNEVPDDAERIRPVLIGSSIPRVQLTTSGGEQIKLDEIVGCQPTVLIFYRGGW
jgi:peroxiredoxin